MLIIGSFLHMLEALQMQCKKGIIMAKFEIPIQPPTTNKTIRFPNDVVQLVEEAIQGKDCTFSAFVIAAVRSALQDLAENNTQASE